MFTKCKLLILLIIIGISIGLVTSDAMAGPPWPAKVTITEGACTTDWVDDDFQTVWLHIDLREVYQPHNGIMQYSCQGKIDFDKPGYASVAEVCSNPDLGWDVFCNGNGTLSVPHGSFWCINEYGDLSV